MDWAPETPILLLLMSKTSINWFISKSALMALQPSFCRELFERFRIWILLAKSLPLFKINE